MQFTTTTILALAAASTLVSAAPTSHLELRNAYGGGIELFDAPNCGGKLIRHVNHDQATHVSYVPTAGLNAKSFFVKDDGADHDVWYLGITHPEKESDPCWFLPEQQHPAKVAKGKCYEIASSAQCLMVDSTLTG